MFQVGSKSCPRPSFTSVSLDKEQKVREDVCLWELRAQSWSCVFFLSLYKRQNKHRGFRFRHVARVLERGVTFCGGVWGSSPRKILNSRGRIPQNLMIFFNRQRNFGCPNIFCSWRKCQTSCMQAGIPRDGLQCTEHLKYMPVGTTCGGAVVLNDLEGFGLFEADEKSVSRQMPRSQMSWKTRDLKSGLEPTAPIASRSEDCALSTQPNPQLQNRGLRKPFQ